MNISPCVHLHGGRSRCTMNCCHNIPNVFEQDFLSAILARYRFVYIHFCIGRYTCMCTRVFVFMCLCVCVFMWVCVYVSVCLCGCVFMWVCVYVGVWVFVFVCLFFARVLLASCACIYTPLHGMIFEL